MNYIGSKFKLLPWLEEEIENVVGKDMSEYVFCDLFAGTGIVGQNFKHRVKKVISNDLEYFSVVLNKHYLNNSKELKQADTYIKRLNKLKPKDDGFIYQNYCLGSGSKRQYFSDINGKKIDTIRKKIQDYKDKKLISKNMFYFLLTSLIESADKVANTASIYGSFLKHLKHTASKDFILEAAPFILSDKKHKVYNLDANELIKKIKGDVLYLDPPYNHRQYGANYHILNTIALNDKFEPQGKTGCRVYTKSDYARKLKVHESFEKLIKNAKFKYIFLSYNSDGWMSLEDIKTIMSKYGKYSLVKKEYKRLKTSKVKRDETVYEFLHVVIKN